MKSIDLEPVRHWAEMLNDARKRKAAAEEQEARAKEKLYEFIGDAEVCTLDGKAVFVHDQGFRKHIPIPKLREKYPEIAAELEELKPNHSLRGSGD